MRNDPGPTLDSLPGGGGKRQAPARHATKPPTPSSAADSVLPSSLSHLAVPESSLTKPARTAPQPSKAAKPWPRGFLLTAAALVAAFGFSWYHLVQLSLNDSLYSHLPLIPFVSVYLVWMRRDTLPAHSPPNHALAAVFLAVGAMMLGAYFAVTQSGTALTLEDSLAWTTFAFLFLFAGVCAWFLGRDLLKAVAFPLGFLIFAAPFPSAVHQAMEAFLQHWSADASYWMISGAGTPILREGLIFHIPGIVLEVAPQCSGIRSTVALFITSVVAGYLFLHSPWKRAVLTLAVIPLAILRNGLRIFTIAQLCVYVSPDMVNSFIHHRGGPIFFALSLIPFLLPLYFLYRSERGRRKPSPSRTDAPATL